MISLKETELTIRRVEEIVKNYRSLDCMLGVPKTRIFSLPATLRKHGCRAPLGPENSEEMLLGLHSTHLLQSVHSPHTNNDARKYMQP